VTGKDTEGIDGAIFKRPHQTGASVTNTIDVEGLDSIVEEIRKNGGTILVPKTPIKGVGYLVYFKDTEGNVLALMEEDPVAKPND
jgi:predicted enzyme related to lactoylglutathione lyase